LLLSPKQQSREEEAGEEIEGNDENATPVFLLLSCLDSFSFYYFAQ